MSKKFKSFPWLGLFLENNVERLNWILIAKPYYINLVFLHRISIMIYFFFNLNLVGWLRNSSWKHAIVWWKDAILENKREWKYSLASCRGSITELGKTFERSNVPPNQLSLITVISVIKNNSFTSIFWKMIWEILTFFENFTLYLLMTLKQNSVWSLCCFCWLKVKVKIFKN